MKKLNSEIITKIMKKGGESLHPNIKTINFDFAPRLNTLIVRVSRQPQQGHH